MLPVVVVGNSSDSGSNAVVVAGGIVDVVAYFDKIINIQNI
jgi:hypothetical protein